jgi:hypothetical protein
MHHFVADKDEELHLVLLLNTDENIDYLESRKNVELVIHDSVDLHLLQAIVSVLTDDNLVILVRARKYFAPFIQNTEVRWSFVFTHKTDFIIN